MTDNITALIAEARAFIAGSNPESARTTLIRDLADALEAEHKQRTRAQEVIGIAATLVRLATDSGRRYDLDDVASEVGIDLDENGDE